ncbi:CMRF35-like molecule 8 [Chanodichthys erythropterus]|uniref:CMRF35-like molecule 8 n=1 Tax=Chanodichthys erythropterus TaxID=933992 RepID=UPI00351E13EA
MWDVLLLFSSICTAVVVGASDTVTGHRGERVEIRCPYEPGYESNSKYFCKGKCAFMKGIIMVKSGSPAKDKRFSLTDDTTNRVFTVTITDLRTEDEGQYWCAVKTNLPVDVYSDILLLVKQKITTEVSTISSFSVASTSEMNPPSRITDHLISSTVIIVTAGALVLVLISVALIIVAVPKKKKSKGLLSSIEEFNPVFYELIKDAGHHCDPEDRDTITTVVFRCVS